MRWCLPDALKGTNHDILKTKPLWVLVGGDLREIAANCTSADVPVVASDTTARGCRGGLARVEVEKARYFVRSALFEHRKLRSASEMQSD